MKLINEKDFDFRKSTKKEKNFTILTFSYLIIVLSFLLMYFFIHFIQSRESNINLTNDYIKNTTQKWDLIYHGQTNFLDDYIKLGKAIKDNDEDSILMYYTLLKSRTDISTMSYLSDFDLEVFSTHHVIIGKKMQISLNYNDSTKKSYQLNDNLISKMKKVYLSRTYPEKINFNLGCDEKINFCYESIKANKIVENHLISNYEKNYQKLKEIFK